MNILIVTQYYWPESFRINDVAKALSEKGIIVDVLTGKPNYPQGTVYNGYREWGLQQEVSDGIDIHRIPLLSRGKGGLRLALNYLSFVISGLLFSPWLLRKKKFDVIFVYAPSPILQALPAIFIGWLKGCPVVLWVQDLWPESLSATGYVQNKCILKLVEYVVRFIYKHVDLLLVQSEAFAASVSALASETPVKFYPNTVDEIFCVPSESNAPDIVGLSSGFSVLFAGNIGSAQAVEVIVDAATLLKGYDDIHFVILGEGSRRDWMLQEVEKIELRNVNMPGHFPVETMPGLMQHASALLVTLADKPIFNLTIPSKVQAYLASGRPIIACLNGEGAKLVNDAKAGIAVPAENAVELSEAILKLYKMKIEERNDIGLNGRSYYEQHFSQDKLINQLVDYFESVVNEKKEYK